MWSRVSMQFTNHGRLYQLILEYFAGVLIHIPRLPVVVSDVHVASFRLQDLGRLGGLAWRMNFGKPGWMVANGAESLYELLLFVTILGLSNCSVAHTLEHSTNQRERIVGSVPPPTSS